MLDARARLRLEIELNVMAGGWDGAKAGKYHVRISDADCSDRALAGCCAEVLYSVLRTWDEDEMQLKSTV